MSENPYLPPDADLAKSADELESGSLTRGIDGLYAFTIRQVWSHAWKRSKGAKAPLLLGMLVFGATAWVLTAALARIGLDGQTMINRGDLATGYFVSMVSGVIISPITVPMMAGLIMMAVRRAGGNTIRFGEMFRYFDRVVPLVVLSFLSTVLIYAGLLLCLLPGIYLSVAYTLALPVLVDKNLSPWRALEASRKAIHARWLNVFGLFVATWLFLVLVSIPVITLVWSLPWLLLCIGTLYVIVFGAEETAT